MTERWGLLLLDKPTGITSHTAVRRAARHLGAPKAGHAGTLDPLASGLLLVGLNKASRLLEHLVGMDKTYIATVRLGEVRDTLDRDGELVEIRKVPALRSEDIEKALSSFLGKITQIPPVHSAVKVGGVPLHRRARRGEDVDPPPRQVVINSIRLLEMALPDIRIEVDCGSGTYVRSLARDLGEMLGAGGSIQELRRTRTGPFSVEDALTMDELEALGEEGWTRVLPPERMAEHLPRLELDEDDERRVIHGMTVNYPPELVWPGRDVALHSSHGALVAIGSPASGVIRPRKVFG